MFSKEFFPPLLIKKETIFTISWRETKSETLSFMLQFYHYEELKIYKA